MLDASRIREIFAEKADQPHSGFSECPLGDSQFEFILVHEILHALHSCKVPAELYQSIKKIWHEGKPQTPEDVLARADAIIAALREAGCDDAANNIAAYVRQRREGKI